MKIVTTKITTASELNLVLSFNTPVIIPTLSGEKVINLRQAFIHLIKGEPILEEECLLVTMEVKRLFMLLTGNIAYLLDMLNLKTSVSNDWVYATAGEYNIPYAIKAQTATCLIGSGIGELEDSDDNITIELNHNGNRSYWTIGELKIMNSNEPIAENFNDIYEFYLTVIAK